MSPLIRFYGALAIAAMAVACGVILGKLYPPTTGAAALVALGLFLYALNGPKCPRCGTLVAGPMDFREWGNGIPGRHCKECEYDLMTSKDGTVPPFGGLMDRLGTVISLTVSAVLVAVFAACVVILIVELCQSLGFFPRPLVRL